MSHQDRFTFAISRLTRRIVFWVFISVILIETLIFIPSYKQREKELLEQMKEISVARVVFAMQIVAPGASNDELYAHIKQLHDGKIVVGGSLNKRKKAEEALQQSFQQVEAYSRVLNNELEKGRQMQVNFLPDQLLQLPGWETAAFFKPARQVAGDFYDLFQLPEGSVGFVVADVCDKGVGAALFMALFRSLIRIFSGQTSLNGLPLTSSDAILDESEQLKENPTIDPNHFKALKAVQLTNKYIALNHDELAMFATLFFGILDPNTGKLSYINGGHEPLYIVNSGGGLKAQLTTTGPVVGIEPTISFKIQQTQLAPGDILLGYTDGVTEANAADGSFFSVEKLMSILDDPSSSARELLDRIANSLQEHIGEAEQFDDITLLAMRRIP